MDDESKKDLLSIFNSDKPELIKIMDRYNFKVTDKTTVEEIEKFFFPSENPRRKLNTMFKCRKCGSNNVRYREEQLRSADEGATFTFTCECGHSWIE